VPFVTVGRENSADIEIPYNDAGASLPIMLVHGHPLDDEQALRRHVSLSS
jgi:non-heme chloroperoxidase